jgi:DsbC/DsbD-like thiol-disulfide interchange protein
MAQVESARALLPASADPELAISAARIETDRLVVEVTAPADKEIMLFAESPAGWYLGMPELAGRSGNSARFSAAITVRPKDPAARMPGLRFTAVAGEKAVEQIVEIQH